MNPLQLREDEIGRKLEEARQTGELMSAEGFGKPMVEEAAWHQTPEEFRMGFKVLKNAGMAPPEVALFQQRAPLRQALDGAADEPERSRLRAALSHSEQKLSIRLESLRVSGSL